MFINHGNFGIICIGKSEIDKWIDKYKYTDQVGVYCVEHIESKDKQSIQGLEIYLKSWDLKCQYILIVRMACYMNI